jgi:hypothetical protein
MKTFYFCLIEYPTQSPRQDLDLKEAGGFARNGGMEKKPVRGAPHFFRFHAIADRGVLKTRWTLPIGNARLS